MEFIDACMLYQQVKRQVPDHLTEFVDYGGGSYAIWVEVARTGRKWLISIDSDTDGGSVWLDPDEHTYPGMGTGPLETWRQGLAEWAQKHRVVLAEAP